LVSIHSPGRIPGGGPAAFAARPWGRGGRRDCGGGSAPTQQLLSGRLTLWTALYIYDPWEAPTDTAPGAGPRARLLLWAFKFYKQSGAPGSNPLLGFPRWISQAPAPIRRLELGPSDSRPVSPFNEACGAGGARGVPRQSGAPAKQTRLVGDVWGGV